MLTCLLGYLTSTTGALNEVKQLESSQYDAHVASSRLNKARKMGGERPVSSWPWDHVVEHGKIGKSH